MNVNEVMGRPAAAADEPEAVDNPAEEQAPGDEAGGSMDNPDAAYGTGEVTPEEQAQYEKIVMAGTKVLYDDATHGKIVSVLKSEKDNPPKAIADATVFVIMALDAASKRTLPQELLIPAAAEIGEQVGELANTAKIFPVDQDVLQKAGMFIVNQLAQTYNASPQDIQAMMGQFTPDQQEQARSQMDAIANPGNQPMPRDAQDRPIIESAMKEQGA